MSTASSTAEVPPGYRVEEPSGAWVTLPWPDDLGLLPPSLGPALIRWAEVNLVHHLTGQPWRYTISQRRFLHWWYAVDPDGRWLYRSGVRRGAKGTGKDPQGAAWCLTELCGPVVFDGWDDKGRPKGRPHRLPLVQIAANSEAQASDVLRVANAMISNSLRDRLGLDPGQTRTVMAGGGRLELLTASMKSAEGDPATAIMLNESHHMTASNGGWDVAEVARRNVAKSPGGLARLVEFTNAHEEGAGSVAEQSYLAWQAQAAGRAARADILYDSREAPAGTDLYDPGSRRAGLEAAYSDAPWVSIDRIEGEVLDPRVTTGESLRYYFNVLAANEDAWVEPRMFDSLARPEVVVAGGEPVSMFLDCSKSSDSTALMACRLSDGHVMTLGVWQRPRGPCGDGWLAPRDRVDAEVRRAFDRWSVAWFGVDPSPATDDDSESLYWATLIDEWHRDFRRRVTLWATPGRSGSAVLFDMRAFTPGARERLRQFAEESQRTAQDIDAGEGLTHDGDSVLRLHAHNARRYPTAYGLSLGKANRASSRLVDAAVAMVGARLGRRLVLNDPKYRARGREAYFF